MAATAIPEEVAAHLHAAIQLLNRRVQMRLLREADVALAEKLPSSAVVIASAVLESALEAVPSELYMGHAADIQRWRAVRNSAAHSPSLQLTLEQAAEMVRGIRDLLTSLMPITQTSQGERSLTVSQLRGKYKSVPTSSTAFIERKADELGLEH
jgi:hypothetical protein